MPGGPLASVGNFTPALEYSVDWIIAILDFMAARGFTYVDARPEAEAAWTNFVREGQKNLLMGDIKYWFTGVNTNIDDRDNPRVVLYVDSASAYRDRCAEVTNRSEERRGGIEYVSTCGFRWSPTNQKKKKT